MQRKIPLLIGVILFIVIAVVYVFVDSSTKGEYRLPELGVALETGRSLSSLDHTMEEGGQSGTILHVKDSSLIIDGSPCTLGAFFVLHEENIATSSAGWTREQLEAATREQQGIPAQVKKLNDGTYLVFEPSKTACTKIHDDKSLREEGKKRLDLWKATQTARDI